MVSPVGCTVGRPMQRGPCPCNPAVAKLAGTRVEPPVPRLSFTGPGIGVAVGDVIGEAVGEAVGDEDELAFHGSYQTRGL